MEEKERFCDLDVGVIFGVIDYYAPYTMRHSVWRKVKPGKWHPNEHQNWELDYNAERVFPVGTQWDKCWVNATYTVDSKSAKYSQIKA